MRFHESTRWRQAVQSIYPDHGASTPARSALGEALALWQKAPGYEAVVTSGARESLLYGLLCAMSGRPSRQILNEVFLHQRAEKGGRPSLKDRLFRLVARRSLGVITNSRHEVGAQARYLGLPPARVRFVPLNANPIPLAPPPGDGRYVFAAGRSGRDYPLLLKVLERRSIPAQLFVGAHDLPGVVPPPGVRIQREASRAAYVEALRHASLVVVPLVPTERSTGQVVLLEAMSLGKAVIASRVPGTVDYVEDGRTGVLVDPGQAAPLDEAISDLWDHPVRAGALGAAARAAVEERFSVDRHAEAKLRAIAELAGQAIRRA